MRNVRDEQVSVPRRLVVVAPHPDDETLGLGGFLSRCAGSTSLVEIVAVSDGEAAYVSASTEQRSELADIRVTERTLALGALGLWGIPIHRLGFADGKLATAEPKLVEYLVEILASSGAEVQAPPAVVVAPWRYDLHPDHEAVGRAAVIAAARCGCELWEVPIWSWYHLGGLASPLPLERASRISLTASERRAKRTALGHFTSQTQPSSRQESVLSRDFLDVFDRDFEIIFR